MTYNAGIVPEALMLHSISSISRSFFASAVCREAAKECRRRKKEYVKCLESRVAVLETQNKQLIEELKTLKELYCDKSEQYW